MSDSFVTPWTVALQALVHGISQARIVWWVPCPPPRDLPDPGIKPRSPALAGGFFTTESSGKPLSLFCFPLKKKKKTGKIKKIYHSAYFCWLLEIEWGFLQPLSCAQPQFGPWCLRWKRQQEKKAFYVLMPFPTDEKASIGWSCSLVTFVVTWFGGIGNDCIPRVPASPGCWQLPETCHLGTKLLSHWEGRLQVQIAHDGQRGVENTFTLAERSQRQVRRGRVLQIFFAFSVLYHLASLSHWVDDNLW